MAALRFLGGFFLLVGALALINDLTKWQLGISESFATPLFDYMAAFAPGSLAALEKAVSSHLAPIIWDPIILSLLSLSLWLSFTLAGLALLWLGRRRQRPQIFVN